MANPFGQYQGLLAANRQAVQPGAGLLDMVRNSAAAQARLSPLDRIERTLLSAGMLPIPGLGDVAGATGDVMGYLRRPETLTPLNLSLSALGLIPFVPGMTAFHGSPHKFAPEPDRYAKADDVIDGLRVGTDVPNTGSISATFSPDEYSELPGIRAVSMSELEITDPRQLFYSADDMKQTRELAEEIRSSGRIDPLIAVRDDEGLYILEGGHRLGALHLLGKKQFPAVVLDTTTGRVASGNPLGAFDASRIGTGEGAQAFGHGLYLAETPGTAGTYIPQTPQRIELNGREIPYGSGLGRALTDVVDKGKDATINELRKHVAANLDYAPDQAAIWQGVLDQVESIDPASIRIERGHLYEVDLPDEMIDRMLDWDKPLSEQPAEIMEKLKSNPTAAAVLDELSMPDPNTPSYISVEAPTGADLYKRMSTYIGNPNHSVGGAFDDAATSAMLDELGIPGIKYFDAAGGGRATGEGTRNFVVFPGEEKALKILRRE